MPKAPTSIASLRHRIVIQTMALTADGQGGFTEAWTTLATVWGLMEPVSARELQFAERIEFRRSHKCVIRYLSTVTTTMRISFDSRYFQIKGIRFPDERKFFMLLDLEEGSAT